MVLLCARLGVLHSAVVCKGEVFFSPSNAFRTKAGFKVGSGSLTEQCAPNRCGIQCGDCFSHREMLSTLLRDSKWGLFFSLSNALHTSAGFKVEIVFSPSNAFRTIAGFKVGVVLLTDQCSPPLCGVQSGDCFLPEQCFSHHCGLPSGDFFSH